VGVPSQLLGFVEHFNRQAYFEAHDVLEELWLKNRGQHRDFYKGLIQTAVAFLKLEQGKLDPAMRLAQRAASHLEKYRPTCEQVDVDEVLKWLYGIARGQNVLAQGVPPRLELLDT
jgi:uncharacterized protein